MDARDLEVRNLTYGQFAADGRAPTAEDVARRAGLAVEDVRAAWRRLHRAHALVLDDTGTELWMANPFAAVPTAHRVRAAGRWWYANCAWDAFGVCAALHVDGRIETSCPDCGELLRIDVLDAEASDTQLLFHCLVPAARWWEDIGFT